ncbi:hypothetical protein [Kitasatospora mediocidica]|uniref:hypothetical protein n=1 Tax=Kitasatospora mediocidica TaxID=58352 RepID=UPI0012FC0C62|nr:hypothetical protein [Kitasatospora mediocidica]
MLGVVLLAASWPVYWQMAGLAGRVGFFGTWLGYVVLLDAVVLRRSGTSPLTRARWWYVGVFVLSVAFWWTYEGLDLLTGNWTYAPTAWDRSPAWALLYSLDFATVLPALFVTAELVSSLRRAGVARPVARSARIPGPVLRTLPAAVPLVVILLAVWPHETYPLLWLLLFLLLDPLNALAGRPSLLADISRGRWGTVVTLGAAALVCGFFWEMWNSSSAQVWVYHVPGLDGSAHLFAMPVVGYAGYIPFMWSAYATYQALRPVLRLPQLVV